MDAQPGQILAIDCGTHSGWAYGSGNALPTWGWWDLAGIQDLAASYVGLDNEVTDAITLFQPRIVVFEAALSYTAGARDPRVPQLLVGLAAHVMSACYRASVPCRQIVASEARKAVLGRGGFRAPFRGGGKMKLDKQTGDRVLSGDAKEEVQLWCREFGWGSISDHNARDAAVLVRYQSVFGDARVMAGRER